MKTIFWITFCFGLSLTSFSVVGQSYKIVDTGQEFCYDNYEKIKTPQKGETFYGQDAQFDGNQPGYKVSAA